MIGSSGHEIPAPFSGSLFVQGWLCGVCLLAETAGGVRLTPDGHLCAGGALLLWVPMGECDPRRAGLYYIYAGGWGRPTALPIKFVLLPLNFMEGGFEFHGGGGCRNTDP